MKCQSCGGETTADVTVCPHCGAPAGQAGATGTTGVTGMPQPRGGGQSAPAAGNYRLEGLATALTVLLAADAVAALGAIVLPVLEGLSLLLFVPIVPVFIVWFYRARKNADGRGWAQRWGPGWAIGSWFVPVVFLWVPYQVMAGVWRAGLPAQERNRPAWLPITWWACWLLAWLFGFRLNTFDNGPVHQTSFGFYLGSTAFSLLFEVAAAIVLIFTIRAVTTTGVGRPPVPDQSVLGPGPD